MAEEQTTGPTGKFQEGKINEYDEGELKIAVGILEGEVAMDFGAPVAWVAFPSDVARALAAKLIKCADTVDSKAGGC